MNKTKYLLLLSVILLGIAAIVYALDPKEILKISDEKCYPFNDQTYNAKLMVFESGQTTPVKTVEMTITMMGHDYQRIEFHSGSDVGMRVLRTDHDNFYVYMPAYQQIKKVSGSALNQPFMGSTFSQTDMAEVGFGDRWEPKLISDTDQHWVIELKPKVAHIEYTKVVIAVRKTDYQVAYYQYFLGNTKVKTQLRQDFKLFQGLSFPAEVRMIDHVKNKMSILKITMLNANQGLKPEDFDRRWLLRGN